MVTYYIDLDSKIKNAHHALIHTVHTLVVNVVVLQDSVNVEVNVTEKDLV